MMTRPRRRLAHLVAVMLVLAAELAVLAPAPVDAASAPVAPPRSVAYIGGSITRLPVVGYHRLKPDTNVLWPDVRAYGKGTLQTWNTLPGYWQAFDQTLAANGNVERVWWMLTIHDNEYAGRPPGQLRAWADDVLEQLRARTSAPVFVSVMASYPDRTCRTINQAPADLAALQRDLIADGLVQAGPVMAPLTRDLVNAAGCHQNRAGQRVHGQQLQQFFG